ncbi:MAG: hypothetical protein AAGI36_00890 [Pseudomonadota bacterium]
MKSTILVFAAVAIGALGYWTLTAEGRGMAAIKDCVLNEIEFKLGASNGPVMRRRVENSAAAVFENRENFDRHLDALLKDDPNADGPLVSAMLICQATN